MWMEGGYDSTEERFVHVNEIGRLFVKSLVAMFVNIFAKMSTFLIELLRLNGILDTK